MIYWGGNLVTQNQLTAGNLASFLMYGLYFGSCLGSFDRIIKTFSRSLGAADKIFELLDHEPQIRVNAGGQKKKNFEGEIKISQVHFSYPTKQEVVVLDNIDFSINKGENVAIVGASGSGKSTVVAILERFYDVGKGNVFFDNVNIKDLDIKWLHQQIGLVSQEPLLFSGSIKENIIYGLESYTNEDINSAIKMANAHFINDQRQFPSGLDTVVGERGVKLSGGQKQRIAIARALIKNPKILIFDEATSALDAESEHQVQVAIDELMKHGQKTVIIIAHRLSTVRNCDRILVFERGQIAEQGTHKDLLAKNGVYKALIERQLSGLEC